MSPLASAFNYVITATTIVAIWTPGAVIIGTDGKAIRGGDLARPEAICKVHIRNNVAIAFTDFIGSPYSGFFALDYASTAVDGDGPFDKKVAEFERLVSEPLSKAVNVIRTTNPQGYSRDFLGKSLLQAVFAGFDGDTPRMKYLRFDIDESQTPVRAAVTQRVEFPSRGEVSPVWPLGRNAAILDYLKRNAGFYESALSNPRAEVHKLIELQINAEPDWVGYPITIVRITKGGPVWLEVPPECKQNN
jgi:hypothetical protein